MPVRLLVSLAVICVIGTSAFAQGNVATLVLVRNFVQCSPSAGTLYCQDVGNVFLGAQMIGTFARFTQPLDGALDLVARYYSPSGPNGGAGCGPYSETLLLSLTILGPSEYAKLEAETFGAPGSAERCAGMGVPGPTSVGPAGIVVKVSPALRFIYGAAWSHPANSDIGTVTLRY